MKKCVCTAEMRSPSRIEPDRCMTCFGHIEPVYYGLGSIVRFAISDFVRFLTN